MKKFIIALDQSISKVGYSLWKGDKLAQFGTFEPTYEESVDYKINEINKWFLNVINVVTNQTNTEYAIVVVFEDPVLQTRIIGSNKYFDNKANNVFVFKSLSKLLGVLINSCIELNIDYELITPSKWKEKIGVTSQIRNQQKLEEAIIIEEAFGEFANEDEVDAVCIGFSYTKNP